MTVEKQMPGVAENIDALYERYRRTWLEWGGPGMRYDFTESLSLCERESGTDVLENGLFAGAVNFVDEYSAVLHEQVFGV